MSTSMGRVVGSVLVSAGGMTVLGGVLLSVFILPKLLDIAAHSVSDPADAELLRVAGSFWGFWVFPLVGYGFLSALLGCVVLSWWQRRALSDP